MKNVQIFLLNMITDSFLLEKWGTLEVERRYDCKNLLIQVVSIVIALAFFNLLKNEGSFGDRYSFRFSVKKIIDMF